MTLSSPVKHFGYVAALFVTLVWECAGTINAQTAREAEMHTDKGVALAAQGKFADAVREFREVTRLQPDFPGGYYNLGLALLNLGEAPEAEKSFRRVVQLAPRHAKARAQLAYALLEQARRSNPARMRETVGAFREAIALDPRNPDLHFNLAFALGRMEDNKAALQEYLNVERIAPRYPALQFGLGVTLYQMEAWTRAADHLRAAVQERPNDFATRYYLGSALLKMRDRPGALEQLRGAAELNPTHPGVHFQLATLYRLQQDREKATAEQRLFRDLNAAAESRWRAEKLENAARSALQQGDLTQGILALSQAYEASPDAVKARNLALAHLQSGHVAEARSFLNRALQAAPQDAATYNYLGLLEAREGRISLALRHFQTAAHLQPALEDVSYNAGVAAAELGNHELAIRYLKAALTQNDSPRVREALAMELEEAGRPVEAREYFEKRP